MNQQHFINQSIILTYFLSVWFFWTDFLFKCFPVGNHFLHLITSTFLGFWAECISPSNTFATSFVCKRLMAFEWFLSCRKLLPSFPLFPFDAKLPLKHQNHHYQSIGVSRRDQRSTKFLVKTSERATALPVWSLSPFPNAFTGFSLFSFFSFSVSFKPDNSVSRETDEWASIYFVVFSFTRLLWLKSKIYEFSF